MFLRTLTNRKGVRPHTYLKLVENHRQRGKVVQKILVNFGNVTNWPEEKVKALIEKLSLFFEIEKPPFFEDVEPYQSLNYGEALALDAVWRRLNLSQLIDSLLADKKVEFQVSQPVKVMVFNRLIEPRSKRGVLSWMKQQCIPGIDTEILSQHYYRALDYLIEIKEPLEKAIHALITDLFTIDLSLVFYDITSSYFEGNKCRISHKGYSRDHRPDREQIEIGLLVNNEGIPISHSVFEGNIKDQNTFPEIFEAMRERFRIKRCVFVGDNAFSTPDNIDDLVAAGYEYIFSTKLRKNQRVMDLLAESLPPRKNFARLKKNLFVKELPSDGETRFIACYNPVRAKETRKKRERRLKESETFLKQFLLPRRKKQTKDREKIHSQIERFLRKKRTLKFFNYEYRKECDFSYHLRKDQLEQEERIDGLLVLQTNSRDLKAKDVANGYRTLLEVEDAFREIKSFIRIRPIRHWAEFRVRGHVFICVLAYLIEKLIEKSLRENAIDLTAKAALEDLSPIKVVVNELMGRRLRKRTEITPEQYLIYRALGITSVPKAT